MIPSVEACFALMARYEMLANIRDHSIMVEKVASLIARGLFETGMNISFEIVTAGALMHDISKTLCLRSGGDHAAEGREICLENNFEEIADIVGEHVILRNYRWDEAINEKEIVYYADKRVNHERIVSLEERLDYLLRRYGNNQEHLYAAIKENFHLCKQVEKKLFAGLNFKPEALAELIELTFP
jgi:uncharacterized protein